MVQTLLAPGHTGGRTGLAAHAMSVLAVANWLQRPASESMATTKGSAGSSASLLFPSWLAHLCAGVTVIRSFGCVSCESAMAKRHREFGSPAPGHSRLQNTDPTGTTARATACATACARGAPAARHGLPGTTATATARNRRGCGYGHKSNTKAAGHVQRAVAWRADSGVGGWCLGDVPPLPAEALVVAMKLGAAGLVAPVEPQRDRLERGHRRRPQRQGRLQGRTQPFLRR